MSTASYQPDASARAEGTHWRGRNELLRHTQLLWLAKVPRKAPSLTRRVSFALVPSSGFVSLVDNRNHLWLPVGVA
jgi:hypothetical protein